MPCSTKVTYTGCGLMVEIMELKVLSQLRCTAPVVSYWGLACKWTIGKVGGELHA